MDRQTQVKLIHHIQELENKLNNLTIAITVVMGVALLFVTAGIILGLMGF